MSALDSLPECGLKCLVEAIGAYSNCSVSDLTCSCPNKAVQAAASTCVQRSCTIPEALTTQNITNTLCGILPHDDRPFFGIIWTFVAISLLLAVLRFVARIVNQNAMGWDDGLALGSAVLDTAFAIFFKLCVDLGVGLDLWAIPQDHIEHILLLTWISLIIYALSRCLIRVSISLFLLRIFRVPATRPFIIATLVLNLVVAIAFVFAIVFVCTPVPYFWTEWDGLHRGKCLDKWPLFLAAGIITTVLDVLLILLPVGWISHLQFSRSKKITTIIMFSLGAIVILTSIMRIISLNTFAHSSNFSRPLFVVGLWSALELYLAVICACLPSLRPLFTLAKARIRGESKSGTRTTRTAEIYAASTPSKLQTKFNSNGIFDDEDGYPLKGIETRYH
ncbi:hypothetical protein F5Y16DRAFT_359204 [Xylariaceae sp. FL0255]|nr:hypothetical protein F5Y16DRAFT_359204 [Xylariaceae sp. FL0255]